MLGQLGVCHGGHRLFHLGAHCVTGLMYRGCIEQGLPPASLWLCRGGGDGGRLQAQAATEAGRSQGEEGRQGEAVKRLAVCAVGGNFRRGQGGRSSWCCPAFGGYCYLLSLLLLFVDPGGAYFSSFFPLLFLGPSHSSVDNCKLPCGSQVESRSGKMHPKGASVQPKRRCEDRRDKDRHTEILTRDYTNMDVSS